MPKLEWGYAKLCQCESFLELESQTYTATGIVNNIRDNFTIV